MKESYYPIEQMSEETLLWFKNILRETGAVRVRFQYVGSDGKQHTHQLTEDKINFHLNKLKEERQ